MTHIASQDLGFILDSYADVIEGGNTHRGSGTAFKGIPGLYSNDRFLRDGSDTPLTCASGTHSTTTFKVASTYSWSLDRWVNSNSAPYFAIATTSSGQNIYQARKITSWNNSTKYFTVGTAFTSVPVANDVFAIQQGFHRLPNSVDIESEALNIEAGFDRCFSLSANAGTLLDWHGDNSFIYKTDLVLTLRLLKYGRQQDWLAAIMSNAMILRTTLCYNNKDFIDGTYSVALYSDPGQQSEIIINDLDKIVLRDSYSLIYKVSTIYR